MLTVFRRHQQVLMLIIAILTIVAFVWLYNRTNLNQVGSNDVLSIHGKVIQRAEVDRLARGYQLAIALGLTDFVKDLGGMGADEEKSLSEFIVNLLVVQKQAFDLGIHPPDEAVAAVIRTLPPLQTDGNFDPAKYASFIQEQLAPRGYTERQMEEMIRDSLKVAELRRVITSPVAVGEAQVREAARIYQPVSAEALRFERDAFLKGIQIAPEEVATFYSSNKEGLKSRESRVISYAVLDLPAAQRKLSGKEFTAALQQLADTAVEAGKAVKSECANGGDFAKASVKAGLQPHTAEGVERDGSVAGKDAGIPQSVVGAAYRLPGNGAVSDIIQDGSSFYVVTVKGITPARQLELAEVTEKLSSLLRYEKAAKVCAESAAKSLEQIRTAMASGKSFSDAAKQAGVKVQDISSVTPSDSKANPEQQAFAAGTLGLQEGELGPLQPAPWGVYAIYLQKRAPLTDAQWNEHRAALAKGMLGNERSLLFAEWLRSARASAQIRILSGNGASGGA